MANRASTLFALALPLFLLLSANVANAAAGPKITAVSSIAGIMATSASGAIVNFILPTATDQYGVALPVSCADSTGLLTSGSTFPIGTTTETCAATDAHNDTVTTSFTLTVRAGISLPTISGTPADITANATSPAGATVSWAAPKATDQYGAALPVFCAAPTGSLISSSAFPIGTTTVFCAASDAYGNTAKASFAVTVSKRPTSISVSCVTPFAFGTATPCTASVKGYLGSVAGESPTLLSSSIMVNGGGVYTGTFTGCTLGPAGSCSFTYTYPVAGSPSISAVYAGDSDNAGSSSLSAPFMMEAVAALPTSTLTVQNATAVNTVAAQPVPASGSLPAITSTGLTIALSVAFGIAIGMAYQKRRSKAAKWRKRT